MTRQVPSLKDLNIPKNFSEVWLDEVHQKLISLLMQKQKMGIFSESRS